MSMNIPVEYSKTVRAVYKFCGDKLKRDLQKVTPRKTGETEEAWYVWVTGGTGELSLTVGNRRKDILDWWMQGTRGGYRGWAKHGHPYKIPVPGGFIYRWSHRVVARKPHKAIAWAIRRNLAYLQRRLSKALALKTQAMIYTRLRGMA